MGITPQTTPATTPPKNIVIRPGAKEDRWWLLDVLAQFNRESGYKTSLLPDAETIETMIEAVAENHICLVAEDDDEKIAGFVAGTLEKCPLNPDVLMFNEMLWWVQPQLRGEFGVGGKLLDEAVAEARRRGAKMIWWSLQDDTKVSSESLRRRGFVKKEIKYLLEV